MTIYNRITLLLKKHNKTRKQLCKETGISYNTLTSLFQRKSENMKLETVSLIASNLNVSVDYLIIGSNNDLFLNEEEDFSFNSDSIKVLEEKILKVVEKLSENNKKKLLSYAYQLLK